MGFISELSLSPHAPVNTADWLTLIRYLIKGTYCSWWVKTSPAFVFFYAEKWPSKCAARVFNKFDGFRKRSSMWHFEIQSVTSYMICSWNNKKLKVSTFIRVQIKSLTTSHESHERSRKFCLYLEKTLSTSKLVKILLNCRTGRLRMNLLVWMVLAWRFFCYCYCNVSVL